MTIVVVTVIVTKKNNKQPCHVLCFAKGSLVLGCCVSELNANCSDGVGRSGFAGSPSGAGGDGGAAGAGESGSTRGACVVIVASSLDWYNPVIQKQKRKQNKNNKSKKHKQQKAMNNQYVYKIPPSAARATMQ